LALVKALLARPGAVGRLPEGSVSPGVVPSCGSAIACHCWVFAVVLVACAAGCGPGGAAAWVVPGLFCAVIIVLVLGLLFCLAS